MCSRHLTRRVAMMIWVCGWALTASAWAQDFEISVLPENPTPFETVLVRVESPAASAYDVVGTRREGPSLVIEMTLGCTVLCPPPSEFSVEVELEPLLQEGTFEVQVEIDGTVVATHLFTVRDYFLQPRLFAVPEAPNDNTAVQAVLSVLSWGEATMLERQRQGQVIDLFMDVPFPVILPPSPEQDLVALDLGILEPGDYVVRLFAEDPLGLERLVWVRTVTVEDAPDLAEFQDRFVVEVGWADFAGHEGIGRPVPGASKDSVLFSFFERSNWELMVKVLDGCDSTGHFWVLTGGATNLAYDIKVTDISTGNEWTSSNPLGQQATAVTDTMALPCP